LDRDLVVIHLYQQPGAGWGELEFYYVSRLRSASAFDDVELDRLAFFQGFEAFLLDGGEMNEHVAASFAFDEAVPFLCVKPFYSSLHAKTFPSYSNAASVLLAYIDYNTPGMDCQRK